MDPVLYFLLLLVSMLHSSIGECNVLSQHFHQELGCKPVYTNNTDCPSHYDCGALEENRRKFCVVRQVVVDKGQKIEAGPEISSPCIPQCYCMENLAVGALSRYRWECTYADCPHYFRPSLKPNCYWKEELKTCCPWQQVCRKELMNCTYNGVTHVENSRFYVFKGNTCNRCICGPSFDGSLNDQTCTELGCDMELHDGEQLLRGCAPVYTKHFCCPLDWRCPEERDFVERTGVSVPRGHQCKFGNLTLNVGDRLLPDDESNCKCSIPPYVVCSST